MRREKLVYLNLIYADIRMWSRNIDMDIGKRVHISRLTATEIEFLCKVTEGKAMRKKMVS